MTGNETLWRGFFAALLAGIGAYAREIVIPVAVLAGVMALDYGTGVAAAWEEKTLSSQTGIRGIVKKAAYLSLVAVGMAVDYILQEAGGSLGVNMPLEYFFGLLMCMWLIINECISILENAQRMGLPVPGFMENVLERLKKRTEQVSEGEEEHGEL